MAKDHRASRIAACRTEQNMNLAIQNINGWAVLTSGGAAFMLGGLWYTALFGAARVRMCGYDDARVAAMQQARPPAVFFSGMLACYLLVAAVLAVLFGTLGVSTSTDGLTFGILVWLGIAAPIGMTGHLAADLPVGVFAIDTAFQLIFLGMMGAILGGWH